MKKPLKVNSKTGQSIIETVLGIVFLVPIVLFLVDIAVLVMANTANDNLAKSACRAAASGKDLSTSLGSSNAGFTAAQIATGNFAESDIINKPANGSFLNAYCWNGTGTPDTQGTVWPKAIPEPPPGNVGVVTSMTVKLPVPFPFLPSSVDFRAKAVEPVVSIVALPDPASALSALPTPSAAGSGGLSAPPPAPAASPAAAPAAAPGAAGSGSLAPPGDQADGGLISSGSEGPLSGVKPFCRWRQFKLSA